MNIVFALFLDLVAYQLTAGWYTCFLFIAVMRHAIVDYFECKSLEDSCWQCLGIVALVALDVLKYGPASISCCVSFLLFGLFRAGRNYFLNGWLLVKIVVILLSVIFIRPLVWGLEANWVMTIREIFGTLVSLTLVLLGTRSSRSLLFSVK